MKHLYGSIVLYRNKKEQVLKAINSFLNTELKVKLFLVDNSPDDSLRELEKIDPRIEYIFNNANLGYGKAHNIAIRRSIEDNVPYHLVLNPDVYFERGVLEKLYEYMENHPDVGNVMPKVVCPDGSIQYLCKLLPTPIDLFVRRFIPFKSIKEKLNYNYELRWTGYNIEMNVPFLSGCFMFLRVSVLKEVGLFDERFFMYGEDTDLNRRIHRKYKTMFYPYCTVVHEHGRESYKSFKMLKIHVINMAKYFNKWGWFFDKERDRINKKAIEEIKRSLGIT